MPPAVPSIESILASAVELRSAAERRQFVEQACGGDAELQRRVEELIENHFRAGSFLESPAPDLSATAAESAREGPGTVIGPYKLLQQLGEGGMGAVFMAEQAHPVQRRVALKIIKPGMDSRQVIARFEAERQALALMDHPHIAQVHDGGTTDSGRPYFVMELVKGVPLNRYCDEHRLTPRERLELFVPVCQAEQLVALDAKLPKVLQGKAQPADAAERIGLARLCQEYKKRYAAAARFYAETFAAQPKLAENLRTQDCYNAACAAALAGCGQGADTANLDAQERARLRRQALDWLRADLTAWGQLLEKGPDQARTVVQRTLRHWQQDADFAGVRGPEALAKLPEAERRPWQQLWADVEALRQRGAKAK
jgi:hypothetical protein